MSGATWRRHSGSSHHAVNLRERARAGYGRYKRRRGGKVRIAVDTRGRLLAVHATPANEQERAQVAELLREVQEVTGKTVKVTFVDQGYGGKDVAQAARDKGIDL